MELDFIAARLEGLEETIIHKLIDRAQFRVNSIVYIPGQSGFEGSKGKSLLEIRLYYQEEMDAQFGRYRQPEERPFNGDLPLPKRIVQIPDTGLAIDDYNKVNLTGEILTSYIGLVPGICLPGDDRQHGSSVVADVYALQAIAERIHFGSLYVAECKFRDNPDKYIKLIHSKDEEGIIAGLTRKDVEDLIIKRVADKVAYIQTRVNTKVRNVIDPEVILTYYRDYIIPFTKKGELRYLLNRIIETPLPDKRYPPHR
ncbi:MAG: chorismate mutase [Spirochaetales bacterium]|nr:chorismate mutase [Spirochaetales bacterium]